MLHSDPNEAKKPKKNTQNHGASLTIRVAGLRQTKAFLREECQSVRGSGARDLGDEVCRKRGRGGTKDPLCLPLKLG